MSDSQPRRARAIVTIGPKIWVPALLLLAAIFASGLWLRAQTGWPDSYGWQCRNGCYIAELLHSPQLIGHGLSADALFVHLWLAPAIGIAGALYILFRRRRSQ